MQADVLQQRDVVQHHAQMIARDRKMQITDAFQAGIADLTRLVDETVTWRRCGQSVSHGPTGNRRSGRFVSTAN